MATHDLVKSWFGREAARFDAIYESDKPLRQQLGDALFRRVILERFSLILNAISAPGRSVLDVGTGPGRYPIELLRRGAERSMGIDIAPEMIEIARREATAAGFGDRADWVVAEFLDWRGENPDGTPQQFDAVIATGYFDYMADPEPQLAKMIRHCKGRVLASFPKRWEARVPLRILRFKLQNGFVRFYSRGDVVSLFRRVGKLPYLSVVDLGRDYIAIYDAAAAARAR